MNSAYMLYYFVYYICPNISEAERRLKELEEERQKLDKELQRAQGKINITEKCMTELQSTILKVPVMTFLQRLRMKRPDFSSLLATRNFGYHLKIDSPSSFIKIRFQVDVKYCVFNNYIITILTPSGGMRECAVFNWLKYL